MKLTRRQALDLFVYNPFTGILKNRTSRCSTVRAGDAAGSVVANRGYLRVTVNKKEYRVHRVIWLMMTGKWPEEIDHLNHIRDDNRWNNIREVTRQENSKNKSLFKNNVSGHVGVCWRECKQKWCAQLWINGTSKDLGCFDRIEDAIKARAAAEIKHGFHQNHGEVNAVQYA